MKRIIITSAFSLAILVAPANTLAKPLAPLSDTSSLLGLKATLPVIAPDTLATKPAAPAAPVVPQPAVYTVAEGDSLSKIGTAHDVEWQRLWAKNTQLTNPDVLKVADKITIPLPNEELKRELPVVVSQPVVTPSVVAPAPQPAPSNFEGGNTYDYGYCTWYVKNRRGASLPNSLGNANTWYSRAAAEGMAVGTEPRAGAVGTTTAGELGHVVYIESVNANGTVNISEMNYKGFGVMSTRTTSAGEFLYIY